MKRFMIAAATLLSAGTASATTTIDFSALPDGAVANPLVLPGATFTAVGGYNTYVASLGVLCPSTFPGDGGSCTAPLSVAFDTPVSSLSFTFIANNLLTVGASVGAIELFSGSTLVGTQDFRVVDTDSFTPDLVSLTGLSSITGVRLTTTDFAGLAYGNFRYNFPATASVPEPASWAMMLAGFGLAGAVMRRRRGMRVAYAA